jgi:selenocysteine-specific elongation factor
LVVSVFFGSGLMSLIIGTAGHIDHGKTALIKALTGIDTDRLKEERERGISIDLGFAYFDAEDGERTGIVDVPGHERFIRNMLAGAHGIDLVLLVVAADDGVMPQTEEHLDILHLLGVRHGIAVVTKIDLVDAAHRAAVREEIEILLDGTGLEGSPICEVSSVTGEGIGSLRAVIQARLRAFARPAPAGCFRLPVDRAFLMRGHGLVVTGTATAGSITTDAIVRVLPGDREARVRAIQVHGRPVSAGHYGQRLALNLAGVEREDVTRGHVVCDPELDRTTNRFDARVELRPAARRPLASHSPVRVYLGTAEVLGKVIWLDGRPALAPKESTYAQLVLRKPTAAFGGDRFILRNQSAQVTIGGGVVLHPFAPRPARRSDPRVAALATLDHARTPAARLDALLALESAFAVAPEYLAAAANLTAAVVREALSGHPGVRPLPDAAQPEAYTTGEKWERLRDAVRQALADYHNASPRLPGMEMESLRSRLAGGLPPKVFRAVVAELEKEEALVRQDSWLRLPQHAIGLDRAERALAAQVEQLLARGGFTPPDVAQVERDLAVPRARLQDLVTHLEREGRVVRVSPDLCYAAEVVEAARALIREHAQRHEQIDAATFRDLIGASRKFSIALLSYFDRTGFTLRVGDVRKLRRR